MTSIKELRKKAGLTQLELSNILHVNQTLISQWEYERKTPTIDSIIAMARIFNVTTDYILGVESEIHEPTELEKIVEQVNDDGYREILKYAKYVLSQDEYQKNIEESAM